MTHNIDVHWLLYTSCKTVNICLPFICQVSYNIVVPYLDDTWYNAYLCHATLKLAQYLLLLPVTNRYIGLHCSVTGLQCDTIPLSRFMSVIYWPICKYDKIIGICLMKNPPTVFLVTFLRNKLTEKHTHNHFMAFLDFVRDYPGERHQKCKIT